MPPWEQTLSDKDRWDLVNYIRSLSAHPIAITSGPRQLSLWRRRPWPAPAPVSREEFDDLQEQLRKMQRQLHYALPGTEHLVIAGDGAVTFTNLQKASSPSTFDAVVSPLILWEPTDRLLVTAAFDLAVGTDTTGVSSSSINVNIADASIIVNDNLIVGGGLFVVLRSISQSLRSSLDQKLPDAPLAFGDSAIGPSSEVGILGAARCALLFCTPHSAHPSSPTTPI